jgi:hypothetical protein
MRHTLIISAFISLTMGINKHDFHVSIADLYLKDDTIQVAIKIFTHDLEETLKETTGNAVFLDNTSDKAAAFKAIKNYCEPRLTIANASIKYELTWVGHEYEDDVTWIYAYAIREPESSFLSVKNTLLQHGHHPQHNMVHLNNGYEIESKICTTEKPEVRFSLN